MDERLRQGWWEMIRRGCQAIKSFKKLLGHFQSFDRTFDLLIFNQFVWEKKLYWPYMIFVINICYICWNASVEYMHIASNFQQVSTKSMKFSKATQKMKKNEKVGKFIKWEPLKKLLELRGTVQSKAYKWRGNFSFEIIPKFVRKNSLENYCEIEQLKNVRNWKIFPFKCVWEY